MKLTLIVTICFFCSAPVFAKEEPIDSEHSTLTIHVGKAGLFSMAGHEHKVTAPIAEGSINDSGEGHIRFRIEAAKLTVLPEKDQAEVQKTMQTKVLESDRFPEIRFESTVIQKLAENHWKVQGTLTLHGQTHPASADVRRSAGNYVGSTTIRQTDFGIQPISVAGGTVKVKDELAIEFSIQAKQ